MYVRFILNLPSSGTVDGQPDAEADNGRTIRRCLAAVKTFFLQWWQPLPDSPDDHDSLPDATSGGRGRDTRATTAGVSDLAMTWPVIA
jgi:hypothetical protein